MVRAKYREIKGDLISLALKGRFDIIIHGCNCFNTMGAGLALQVRRRLPALCLADTACKVPLEQRLGSYAGSILKDEKGKRFIGINAYTQFNPGPNFDIHALHVILFKINISYSPGQKIGLPLIGCGIGGGDWKEVKKVIKSTLTNHHVTIVKYGNVLNN